MRIYPLVVAAILTLVGSSCGPSERDSREQQTISRETFIEAYVQLRMKELRLGPEREIDLETRDSILSDLGVTADQLLTFVEVWGMDGEVMQEVWGRIDSVIRQARVDASDDDYEDTTIQPDTGGVSSGPRGSHP